MRKIIKDEIHHLLVEIVNGFGNDDRSRAVRANRIVPETHLGKLWRSEDLNVFGVALAFDVHSAKQLETVGAIVEVEDALLDLIFVVAVERGVNYGIRRGDDHASPVFIDKVSAKVGERVNLVILVEVLVESVKRVAGNSVSV